MNDRRLSDDNPRGDRRDISFKFSRLGARRAKKRIAQSGVRDELLWVNGVGAGAPTHARACTRTATRTGGSASRAYACRDATRPRAGLTLRYGRPLPAPRVTNLLITSFNFCHTLACVLLSHNSPQDLAAYVAATREHSSRRSLPGK
jgi:hypothetical protein